jgi:outer membrane protein assembly factor BamB
VLWRVPLAAAPYDSGPFGSLAVAQGRVLTLTTNGCEALDARSGQRLWVTSVNVDAICHSTPTVNAGRAYVYGASTFGGSALLSCLDATDGHVLWAQSLADHVTSYAYFYNSSQSPLVEDGRVFVSAVGQDHCVLAFNATNGAVLWKAHRLPLLHASPVMGTFGGVRQLLGQGGYPLYQLYALAPEDGRLLWQITRSSAIYTTPVICGDCLLSPERPNALFRVALTNGAWGVTQVWSSAQFTTAWTLPVVKDGFIYEIDARGQLGCFRFTDGALQWSTNGFGRGSLVLAGSRLVALAETGWLNIIDPSPANYRLVCCFQPLTNNCLNLPAVANGSIYLRNDSQCVCLDTTPAPLIADLDCRNPANYTLTVRTADFSILDAARADRVGLETASPFPADGRDWTPFYGPRIYTNSTLVYGPLPLSDSRFFRACETNAP